MRSLFFKIFFWFWLAMALVVLAHALSTMAVMDQTPRRMLMDQLETDGLPLAQKYEQEGKAGVEDYLRRPGSDPGNGPRRPGRGPRAGTYLFDQNGAQLAGREAPPQVQEIVQSLVAGGDSEFVQTPRTDFAARKIRTPNGGQYILAIENGRPTGIRLPFWPGVWWAQLLAVLLTTGIVCYLLGRYLTSPVVKLRAATRQLAAGDLSARVGAANGRRRDELADLGRDFDIMAERLESLMNSQRRLLHDISHELRSPLARLKVALELARQNDPEEAAWALDRIDHEADRLNDLIGQLLTLARLESDSPAAGSAPISLKNLVDEVVLDANFEAQNSDRSVKVVTSRDCLAAGDEQLLRSAIENVIRNAVSYTAEGTQVEVSLRCEGEGEDARAIIRVQDRGAGVPQEALADIFRPFYRVADARDRQSGGIGLGLSISQRAVQAHGGAITASNASGGGLLVEIRLPIIRREAAEVS